MEDAVAGEHWERAASLIERQYASEWVPGERRTLERWLRALPPALIQTRPHLSQTLAGLHLYYYRATEAEQVLNECRFEPRDAGAGGARVPTQWVDALWGNSERRGGGRFGCEADSDGPQPPSAGPPPPPPRAPPKCGGAPPPP